MIKLFLLATQPVAFALHISRSHEHSHETPQLKPEHDSRMCPAVEGQGKGQVVVFGTSPSDLGDLVTAGVRCK